MDGSSVSHCVVKVQLLLKLFIDDFIKATDVRATNHCSLASPPSTTEAPAEIPLPFCDSLLVPSWKENNLQLASVW